MNYRMAYRYRFYPTLEQKAVLAEVFGHARYVWNWGLELRQRSYHEEGKSLTYTETAKRLTLLKRDEDHRWLQDVSIVVLQQKLRDLDQAFKNFFTGDFGFPRFKKKGAKQSVRFTSNGFTLYGKRLAVARVPGVLNVRWSRDPEGDVTSVTLTKDPSGRYFVSLTAKVEKEPLAPIVTGPGRNPKATGIDLGLTDIVVTSDGFRSGNPKHLERDLYRLKRAQRRLARKVPGSANYRKQKRRVARIHAKIKDRRNDFLHKLSRKFVDESQVLGLETLSVQNMLQNRSLSRAIHDASWATLVRYIEYKAEWAGRTVVKVDRWFPSSRQCSACGHILKEFPLSKRSWTCPDCDATHDRDVNAAKNIRTVGLTGAADAAMTLEGTVRPRLDFMSNGRGPAKE